MDKLSIYMDSRGENGCFDALVLAIQGRKTLSRLCFPKIGKGKKKFAVTAPSLLLRPYESTMEGLYCEIPNSGKGVLGKESPDKNRKGLNNVSVLRFKTNKKPWRKEM